MVAADDTSPVRNARRAVFSTVLKAAQAIDRDVPVAECSRARRGVEAGILRAVLQRPADAACQGTVFVHLHPVQAVDERLALTGIERAWLASARAVGGRRR